MKLVSIRDDELHRQFKQRCALVGRPMTDILDGYIRFGMAFEVDRETFVGLHHVAQLLGLRDAALLSHLIEIHLDNANGGASTTE